MIEGEVWDSSINGDQRFCAWVQWRNGPHKMFENIKLFIPLLILMI